MPADSASVSGPVGDLSKVRSEFVDAHRKGLAERGLLATAACQLPGHVGVSPLGAMVFPSLIPTTKVQGWLPNGVVFPSVKVILLASIPSRFSFLKVFRPAVTAVLVTVAVAVTPP